MIKKIISLMLVIEIIISYMIVLDIRVPYDDDSFKHYKEKWKKGHLGFLNALRSIFFYLGLPILMILVLLFGGWFD